jgi:hypothetical protein
MPRIGVGRVLLPDPVLKFTGEVRVIRIDRRGRHDKRMDDLASHLAWGGGDRTLGDPWVGQQKALFVGDTSRELGEQRPDVRLADAVVDAVRDDLKRPFAGGYAATRGHVERLSGCHRFPL